MRYLTQTLKQTVIVLAILSLAASIHAATRIIEGHGYDNLIEIRNGSTQVILEPNMGGRVLAYKLNGVEILYQDPAQAGLHPTREVSVHRIAGGRFDVGPTFALPQHNTIWQCAWTGEITGDYSARLISQIDPDLGIQLVRDFTLSPDNSKLDCKQTIINHNDVPFRGCFWSRTFAKGGGVSFAPLKEDSRFPMGYALNLEPRGGFQFLPQPEPAIRVRDNILEIFTEPSDPKSIFNLSEGWLAYVSPDNLLFLKTFPFDTSWRYADPPQHHASFWHLKDEIVEIEPNGPQEIIPPGGKASFTETWQLIPFELPSDKQVDLGKLRETVKAHQ
jgi:hypothetical protein